MNENETIRLKIKFRFIEKVLINIFQFRVSGYFETLQCCNTTIRYPILKVSKTSVRIHKELFVISAQGVDVIIFFFQLKYKINHFFTSTSAIYIITQKINCIFLCYLQLF